MAEYRVIWFDDEYESLDIIREKANLNDINLVGYSNSKDGIEELERNIKSYDAAILDGLFYMTADETGVPTSDKPFFETAMALLQLAPIKILPWFILSGQPSFTKEKNRYADGLKDNQVHDKLNDAHLESLWHEIKTEANKQIETQIRHKYNNIFSICTEKYIGGTAAESILYLLKTVESDFERYNTEEKLNSIRKIITQLFTAFKRIGVLPPEVMKGEGGITNSSRFLSGNHPNYHFSEKIAPPVISFLLKNALYITQDGSHREEDLRLDVDQFIKGQPTGYLFNSVIFQVFEILLWLKDFFDSHQDYEKNKAIAYLKPVEPAIIGVIQQDKKLNYYYNDIILPFGYVTQNGFKTGDKIKITGIEDNTNTRTNTAYPKYAKAIEKI